MQNILHLNSRYRRKLRMVLRGRDNDSHAVWLTIYGVCLEAVREFLIEVQHSSLWRLNYVTFAPPYH